MKTIKIFGAPAALILLLAVPLLLAGCGNLFQEPADTGEGGTLHVKLYVPDYRRDAGTADSRIIAPETFGLRMYLDGEEFIEIPGLVPVPVEESDPDRGQPLAYSCTIGGVPARYYRKMRFELLDISGAVLSTGTAFDVDVAPFVETRVSVAFFLSSDTYTFISTDGETPLSGTVPADGMAFYKFYGYVGTRYTIDLTATDGSPDMYLFLPDGAPARNELDDFISVYGGGEIAFTAGRTGMYVAGVYGWNGEASYSLSVSSDTEDPARILVQDAYAELRAQDWDGAYQTLTQAVSANPSNPEAVLGYSVLSIANVFTDPEFRAVASENLGIIGYPATLGELFSTSWLERYIQTYEGYDSYEEYEMFLPQIADQELFDGALNIYHDDGPDGIIDPSEKMLAFAHYFFTHNTGLNDVAYTLSTVFSRHLGIAAEALEGIGQDATLTVTWDMLYDTPEQAYDLGWPFMPNQITGMPEPMPFTIGKAEAQLLSGMLEAVRMLANYGRSFNYTLLWSDGTSYLEMADDFIFYESNGVIRLRDDLEYGTLPPSPMSVIDFLKPSADAERYLETAGLAAESFLEKMEAGLTTMAARPEGSEFLLSPEMLSQMMGADSPAALSTRLRFAARTAAEMRGSLLNGTIAVIPTDVSSTAEEEALLVEGAWPTAVTGSTAIGINLAHLFDQPFSALLECRADGEPVWYGLEGTTFTALSLDEMDAVDPADEDSYYFARIPGGSLTRVIPIENFATDDPETVYAVSSMEWEDWYYPEEDPRRGNDLWDPGEPVYSIQPSFAVENGILGIWAVDVADLAAYTTEDGMTVLQPEEYYRQYEGEGYRSRFIAWLSSFPAETSPLLEFTDASNVDGLIQLLELDIPGEGYAVDVEPMELWGGFLIYRSGTDLYLKAPAETVWHSVAPAGTTAYDPDGYWIESTGSIWYIGYRVDVDPW